MKAAYIRRFGGPEAIEFGEVDSPVQQTAEALIDIHAASVNAVDADVRRGQFGSPAGFPLVPGRDFAGVVAELPDGADHLSAGDRVFGVTAFGREGAYAERIAIDASIIARLPDEISFVGGAALALIGITAVVSIEETLDVKAGETVLIHGGAGGVGGIAVQLAKQRGATVIVTARREHFDYLTSIGADRVLDYRDVDLAAEVKNCDAVFDAVGGDVALRSFEVLAPGGRAAFIASGATAPTPPRSDVRSLRPAVSRDRRRLERLARLVVDGDLKLPPIVELPLQQAGEAHRLLETRGRAGKIVLRVR